MLRFDADGNSAFEEMSRVDILRMAQDAATPVVEKLSLDAASEPAREVPTPKARGQTPYGTICDVQVRAGDDRFAN